MKTLFGLFLTLGLVAAACGRAAEPPDFGSGGFPGGAGGWYGAGGGGTHADTCVGSTPVVGVTPMADCAGAFTQGIYTGRFTTISDALDGGGSTICPQCSDLGCTPKITTAMCTAGRAGKVLGTAYSTYWGAGLVWNLNQPLSTPSCMAGAPGVVDLTGKTIAASFDTPPVAFRIQLDTGNPAEYLCADISSKSAIKIAASDFVDQCWTSGTRAPITPAQLASVKSLRFMVPTNASADVPFYFCITSLSIQ